MHNPTSLEQDLGALDAAIESLPHGPVRHAAREALVNISAQMLELLVEKQRNMGTDMGTDPTKPPPPDPEPHTCSPVGDGGLCFCSKCGRTVDLADADPDVVEELILEIPETVDADW